MAVDPNVITSGGSAGPGQPMVFLGHVVLNGAKTRAEHLLTPDQAVLQIYGDDALRASWGKQLYTAGLLKSPTDFDGIVQTWTAAVQESAKFKAAGKNVTPQDVIGLMAGTTVNPKPTRSTSKSTTLPSQTDIQHAVTSMFQEQLGRDPTPNEIARYGSMLTGAARKNPQTTTTTTSTDAAGNTSSSSTTSGGVDLGQVAQNLISDNPEHGVYQAATNIMDWVHQALGAAA